MFLEIGVGAYQAELAAKYIFFAARCAESAWGGAAVFTFMLILIVGRSACFTASLHQFLCLTSQHTAGLLLRTICSREKPLHKKGTSFLRSADIPQSFCNAFFFILSQVETAFRMRIAGLALVLIAFAFGEFPFLWHAIPTLIFRAQFSPMRHHFN